MFKSGLFAIALLVTLCIASFQFDGQKSHLADNGMEILDDNTVEEKDVELASRKDIDIPL